MTLEQLLTNLTGRTETVFLNCLFCADSDLYSDLLEDAGCCFNPQTRLRTSKERAGTNFLLWAGGGRGFVWRRRYQQKVQTIKNGTTIH